MFITPKAQTSFSDTKAMKERFQSAAARAGDEQEVKDKLERIGTAYLALDGTDFDQDDAPGSVAVGNDKLIAIAQARPLGGVLSLEVLDERGPETKEYTIEPDLTGVSYSMNENGVQSYVYENGNGLLALMEQIQSFAPESGEEPKEEKPKED